MVYDICIKVKEIGDVYGNYCKTTKNSIYLRNTLLGKASSVLVAGFKIEKKYIISVTRMGGTPHFESFSSPQLKAVIELNIPAYTEKAQGILSQRALEEKQRSNSVDKEELCEMLSGGSLLNLNDKQSKNRKKKGEWNQFAANQKLYGITPEFDLNDYSTEINRNASNYKELEERSSKIAKEIMSQATNDTHRLEERGITKPSDFSEDKLYSAVNAEERWAETSREEVTASSSSALPPPVCEKASIIKELEEIGKLSKNYSETSDKDAWTGMAIALLSKKRALENKLQELNEEKKEPKDGSGSSDKLSNEKDEAARRNKESFKKNHASSDRQKNDEGQRGRNGRLNQRTSSRRHFDGGKNAESETKSKKSGPEIDAASFNDVHECIEAMINCFETRRNDQSSFLPRSAVKYCGDLYLSYTKAADNFEFSDERMNDIIAGVQKDSELFHKKHKLI